jgi:hypothetical protein
VNAIDDERAVEEIGRKAEKQYHEKSVAYQQNEDPSYCFVCGLIGFRLMQRALMEQMLADESFVGAEQDHIAKDLARSVALPMPKHRSGHGKFDA